MKVLVYFEVKEGGVTGGSLELVTAGRLLGEVSGIVVGADLDAAAAGAANYGATVIYISQEASGQDEIVDILESEIAAGGYGALLVPASSEGKDVAPRVAARFGSCSVTDVAEIRDGVLCRRVYGGAVIEKMSFTEGKKIFAAIQNGCFPKPDIAPAKVIKKTIGAAAGNPLVQLTEKTKEAAGKADLEGAGIVVAGGRGCKDEETFALVRELAALLGAEVGATRPLVESGWISRAHQIGQSGKSIAPKLYIACGISGAMQHVCGVINAGYIVAVNQDESAPVFDIADVGIVGRCERILPLMIEAIKKQRI